MFIKILNFKASNNWVKIGTKFQNSFHVAWRDNFDIYFKANSCNWRPKIFIFWIDCCIKLLRARWRGLIVNTHEKKCTHPHPCNFLGTSLLFQSKWCNHWIQTTNNDAFVNYERSSCCCHAQSEICNSLTVFVWCILYLGLQARY